MTTLDRSFWTRAVVLTAMVSGGVFFSNRFAKADPGDPTRAFLTFAGTLDGTPTSPAPELTFTFRKGETTLCAPRTTPTFSDATHFTAQIPLQSTASRCPDTMFDGSDVTVEVSVRGTAIGGRQPINPVPYARYADQVGTPDCPVGYERDRMATGMILCRRPLAGGASDEVVRVGSGASAFWIDRYEASIWQNADGSGSRYGSSSSDYPTSFPETGQWSTPLYALSRRDVLPSVGPTWFQAQQSCALSGKRLPTGNEWLLAATGTRDPGVSDGNSPDCATMAVGLRAAGRGTSCVSVWGAQDMIGNVGEWTSEWYASVGSGNRAANWPAAFRDDGTWNVNSDAWPEGITTASAIPAAAVRGGSRNSGINAGTFALLLQYAPSRGGDGFRCVIPR